MIKKTVWALARMVMLVIVAIFIAGCGGGSEQSFVPNSYTVSLSSGAVYVKPISAGSTGVEMLSLDIAVKNCPIAIQTIELGNFSLTGVGLVTIFDGSTLVGSGMFMSGWDARSVFALYPAVRISAHSKRTLRVMVDFPLMLLNTDAGEVARVQYYGSSGVNMVTGGTVKDTVGDKSWLSGQAVGYIFKSTLRVDALKLPTGELRDGTNVLFRVADTASVFGDIDIYRKTFMVTKSLGLSITNLRLVDEETGISIPASLVDQETGLPIPLPDVDPNSSIIYGFNFEQARTILAGTRKSFALTAEVSGVSPWSFITAEMLWNDGIVVTNQVAADLRDEPLPFGKDKVHLVWFIWSDMSKIPHNLNSADWHNGDTVDGFPLPAATLSAVNNGASVPIVNSVTSVTGDFNEVAVIISGNNFIDWSVVQYLSDGKVVDSFCAFVAYPKSNGTLTHG